MENFSGPLDVAVIGAGPAGLMAAIGAAQAGARTAILDQMPGPGAKLLVTGGGRCNLTNTSPPEEFMRRFGRQGRFMAPALEAFGTEKLRTFLLSLGVPTACADGFHVFPASNRAEDVLEALARACGDGGARGWMGAKISALTIGSGRVCGVEADGTAIPARAVVAACGGASYPELGATGSGYALARQAGHTVPPPVPALVPLVTRETWAHALAGVSLPAARVRLAARGAPSEGRTGELLFTHRGLSGPVILDASGDVAEVLRDRPEVPIEIEPVADLGRTEWLERLDRWRRIEGRRTAAALLGREMPASLARAVCAQCNLAEDLPAARWTKMEAGRLALALGGLRFTVVGTGGFENAMITRGGVRLKEVNPATLESRFLPGLFFAGEMLDLDGPCGGYNLQWAFSSGYLAGLSAARFAADAQPFA